MNVQETCHFTKLFLLISNNDNFVLKLASTLRLNCCNNSEVMQNLVQIRISLQRCDVAMQRRFDIAIQLRWKRRTTLFLERPLTFPPQLCGNFRVTSNSASQRRCNLVLSIGKQIQITKLYYNKNSLYSEMTFRLIEFFSK